MNARPRPMAAMLLAFVAASACAAPLAHLTAGRMVVSFDSRGYFRVMYKGVTVVPEAQIYLADQGWADVYPSRHGRNYNVKIEGDPARRSAHIVARKNLFSEMTIDCTVEPNRLAVDVTRKVLPETATDFAVIDVFLAKSLLAGSKFVAKRKTGERKGTIDPGTFGQPIGGLQSLHLDTYVGGIDIALSAEAPPSAWQLRSVCDRTWGAEELRTFSLLSCYSSVPKAGADQHLTFGLTIEESPEIDATLYRRSMERGAQKLHDAVAAQRKRLGMGEPAALTVPNAADEIAALQSRLMRELDSLRARRGRFIVPQPQHVQWGEAPFRFTPKTRIFLGPQAGIGAQRAAKVLMRELSKIGLNLSTAPANGLAATALVVGDRPAATAVDAPLPAEGYTLNVTPTAIALAGRDDRGAFYAAQSLVQIVERSADGVVTMPAVSVRDWPDLKQRGIHIWGFGSGATVDDVKRTVTDIAARYKLNRFAFGSSYPAFHWRSHPEIRTKPGGVTMDQLAEIAQLARDNFMEFVPAFQSYGHLDSLFRSHPEIAECWKPERRYNSYCPSNPKTYELIFDLFQEVIDATQPKTFHIGHDEISGIGYCDKCKATLPHVLLANDITKIRNWLDERGIETMLWGDMLLDSNEWAKTGIGAHNSNRGTYGAKDTHLALDLLPKDVIIADWHYSGVNAFGSLAHFRDKGFRVLACPWFSDKNNYYFALSAAKAKIEGLLLTDWGFLSTLSAAGTSVLGMEYAWTPGKPELDALPYYPPELLANQLRPRRPSDAPDARFIPVDLSALPNARSTAKDVSDFQSWFGLGGTMDLSLLSRGLRTLAGIDFALLPTSANDCIMFGGQDVKSLPAETTRIPLGRRAHSVVLLQATSTTDPGVWHKPVAKVVCHYADGTQTETEVKENRDVTHWQTYQRRTNPWHWREGNADLYGTKCAWRGFTRSGDAINLQAYEWVNPQPAQPLSHLQLRALKHGEALKIAVLAVTCVE